MNQMMRFQASSNEELIEYLKGKGVVRSSIVINSMKSVDRKIFINNFNPFNNAYIDAPQSIGFGRTISAPHMHGLIFEKFVDELSSIEKVLIIRDSTGYVATCMALMMGPNVTIVLIERNIELLQKIRQNINTSFAELLISKRIQLIQVSHESLGCSTKKPYNIIYVGAAATEIPKEYLSQLAPNGRLIMPVGLSDGQILLQIDKTEDGRIFKKSITSVKYGSLYESELKVQSDSKNNIFQIKFAVNKEVTAQENNLKSMNVNICDNVTPKNEIKDNETRLEFKFNGNVNENKNSERIASFIENKSIKGTCNDLSQKVTIDGELQKFKDIITKDKFEEPVQRKNVRVLKNTKIEDKIGALHNKTEELVKPLPVTKYLQQAHSDSSSKIVSQSYCQKENEVRKNSTFASYFNLNTVANGSSKSEDEKEQKDLLEIPNMFCQFSNQSKLTAPTLKKFANNAVITCLSSASEELEHLTAASTENHKIKCNIATQTTKDIFEKNLGYDINLRGEIKKINDLAISSYNQIENKITDLEMSITTLKEFFKSEMFTNCNKLSLELTNFQLDVHEKMISRDEKILTSISSHLNEIAISESKLSEKLANLEKACRIKMTNEPKEENPVHRNIVESKNKIGIETNHYYLPFLVITLVHVILAISKNVK